MVVETISSTRVKPPARAAHCPFLCEDICNLWSRRLVLSVSVFLRADAFLNLLSSMSTTLVNMLEHWRVMSDLRSPWGRVSYAKISASPANHIPTLERIFTARTKSVLAVLLLTFMGMLNLAIALVPLVKMAAATCAKNFTPI